MTPTKTVLPLTLLLSALSACTHYEERPVKLQALAQSQMVQTLDANDVTGMRARLAPGTGASAQPDRLWLLAAIMTLDPKVASARAAIATAEARARAERHVAAPTLTLTGEYANDPSTKSPWLIGSAVDLPLDIGGRRSARLRSANLAVTIARYDFAEVVWAERMAARQALIDRFIAERRIALDVEMLTLRERQLAAADRRLKSGEVSSGDRELARLSREAAARDLALAQSRFAQSAEAIGAILGLPAAALADRKWMWSDFDMPSMVDATGDDARIAAITARGDVLKALADYDRADAAYRAEIAKQFPALTVSPGYTWERGLVKLPLSLGLALPPLDLNRHAIAAASKAREEAGMHLEAVVAAAGGAIDAALVERRLAQAALERIRDHDLPVARTVAKRADDRLRLGAIDRIEWADAQAALLDARAREIDALARAQTAEAALEDAFRRPLEGPETTMAVSVLEAVQ